MIALADKKRISEKCSLSGEEGKEMSEIFKSRYFYHIQEMCCIIQDKTVVNSFAGLKGYILQFIDNTYITCFLDDKVKKMNWYYQDGQPGYEDLDLINYVEIKNYFSKDAFGIKEIINNGLKIKKCCGETVDGGTVGEDTFNISFKNHMEIDSKIVFDKNDNIYLSLGWQKY